MRMRERGFSLLYLMVTTTVAGIITAVAIPNLSSALQAHRLTAALRTTVGCIGVARSTAVTRNQQARISLSGDGTTLTVQVNSGGTWTSVGTPAVLEGGVTVSSVSPSGGLLFSGQGTVGSAVTVTVQNDVRRIPPGGRLATRRGGGLLNEARAGSERSKLHRGARRR